MRHAEILKGGKRADGRSHQIIGDEQKRADNGYDFAAMPHAGVNAAAVGIKAADDHVVEADECSEHAHRRDQPKRTVACDSERKPNDVGLARPPVAIKDCRRALPIHIARSLNVCWYQLIRLKRDRLARRGALLPGVGFHDIHCPLMMLTRLAVGLEPLNALDAAHRSPRSAPLLARSEFGSPVGPATRRSIKRNKELAKSSDWQTRQSSEPLAACAFRTLHWR